MVQSQWFAATEPQERFRVCRPEGPRRPVNVKGVERGRSQGPFWAGQVPPKWYKHLFMDFMVSLCARGRCHVETGKYLLLKGTMFLVQITISHVTIHIFFRTFVSITLESFMGRTKFDSTS